MTRPQPNRLDRALCRKTGLRLGLVAQVPCSNRLSYTPK